MDANRLSARIIIVNNQRILGEFDKMCFDDKKQLERFMEGLSAGYALGRKAVAGCAAIIDDDIVPTIHKNMDVARSQIVREYLENDYLGLWNELAHEILTEPEKHERYSSIFSEDIITTHKLRKFLCRLAFQYNIRNCAFDKQHKEFVIDRFDSRAQAEECFYGIVPFYKMSGASIERYDEDLDQFWICIPAQ